MSDGYAFPHDHQSCTSCLALREENARLLIACELNRKRAERLEAKLAKVVLILEDYAQDGGDSILSARALAAAKGQQ